MWTERKTDDYRVLRVPPMVAVQAEWVETQTLLLAEQAHTSPPLANLTPTTGALSSCVALLLRPPGAPPARVCFHGRSQAVGMARALPQAPLERS